MSQSRRKTKSFTIEMGVLAYVQRTRGRTSASERVNQMLKRAMRAERAVQLEREAAEFFAEHSPAERRERKSLQRAALRVLARDKA